MQSVQLPTIGILLSKKGICSEGAGVSLKAYVKHQNIGNGIKSLNGIPIWRTPFTISDWNGVRFPASQKGRTQWKAAIGNGVQDLLGEVLLP